MKISVISSNLFYTRKSDFNKTTLNLKKLSDNNIDSVSFSSLKNINNLKIKHIKCPYCDKDVLIKKEFSKIVYNLWNNNGKALQKELKLLSNISIKNTIEKKFIDLSIKTFENKKFKSKLPKNKDINDVLEFLFPAAEKKLIAQQRRIIKLSKKNSEELSEPTKKLVDEMFKTIDNILLSKDSRKFKRKTLLGGFYSLSKNINNKKDIETLNIMMDNLLELPTSTWDLNSFIVKYKGRTKTELAQRLVVPISSTKEHIIPQEFFRNNPDGAILNDFFVKTHSKNCADSIDFIRADGKNYQEQNNLLICHSHCNSARSNIPLDELIKEEPLLKKYILINLNSVIKNAKDKNTIEETVKTIQTLNVASNGLLDFIYVPKRNVIIENKHYVSKKGHQ